MKRIAATAATAVGILALALFMGGAMASGHGGGPDNHSKDAATAQQSSALGVKPSNDTQKNTHAQAGSDKTKLYGNGDTAGQIAIANGASPATDLYGPGNSQPHKVAVCGGHEVDVHALKSHNGDSCAGNESKGVSETETTSQPSTSTTAIQTPPCTSAAVSSAGDEQKGDSGDQHGDSGNKADDNHDESCENEQGESSESTATTITMTHAPASTSSVLGATHKVTLEKHHRAAVAAKPAAKTTPKATSGVLGSLHPLTPVANKNSTGVLSAKLPFTGLPLWPALAAAFGLLLAGGAARVASRRT